METVLSRGASEPAVIATGASKRIAWIDFARAIAICFVVLCHSTEAIYSFALDAMAAQPPLSQMTAFGFFTIGRLGVPLFLFISGYLMLDRFYDRAACVRFWRTKWLGLLLATEIWIVVYCVFLSVHNGRPLDVGLTVKTMLFLENVGMGHMWYMPMILGLYLFLPFIASGLKALDDARLLRFPLLLAVVLFFVPPVASQFADALGFGTFTMKIATGFSGGAYGCYMLLGYCFKKGAFDCLPLRLNIAGVVLGFAATVGAQMMLYNAGVRAPMWYNSVLLLGTSLCLFGILSKLGRSEVGAPVRLLSRYSFAIYLVHYPVKILLAPVVQGWEIPGRWLQVLLLSVLVMAISLVVCVAIAHIPKVGAKILYMR